MRHGTTAKLPLPGKTRWCFGGYIAGDNPEKVADCPPEGFIFQEKSEPHEVTLIRLSGSFHELAERRVARARRLWGKCVTANQWPGYPIGMHEVDPPAWLVERSLAEAM